MVTFCIFFFDTKKIDFSYLISTRKKLLFKNYATDFIYSLSESINKGI